MTIVPTPRGRKPPISELPRPRQSHHDRHHLFWTGADFRSLGLSRFRDLPCTSSFGTDPLVHSLVHQRFGPVPVMRLNHTDMADFRLRTERWVDRHEQGRCSCRTPSKLCAVDALTLEAMPVRELERPPCTALLVDGPVYELMRDYYVTETPVTDRVRDELARRCDDGRCGCIVTRGGKAQRDPAIYRQLLRSAS